MAFSIRESDKTLVTKQPVFRFAPSPNGFLHLGHALSALINFKAAEQLGGRFLLRIEDIDLTRTRETFIDALYDDLDWLGLTWETPVRRQSDHRTSYAQALARLKKKASLYPAFLSRREIRTALKGELDWPVDPDGTPHYPPHDRNRSESDVKHLLERGTPFAERLHMTKTLATLREQNTKDGEASLFWHELENRAACSKIPARPDLWGDVLLARKDFPASYHLSVVVDDEAQGVTHVVRGQDLYEATSVHRLLQNRLGYDAPLYHHHRLVLGPDGRKLSKSLESTNLQSLRREGLTPNDIKRMIGFSDEDLRAFQPD